MKLYSGIDLHSTNSYLAIIDGKGKHIFNEKLPNDISTILQRLELFSGTLQGVVIESTYNWYWLVDGLMAEGFAVHLANPSAIQKYKGLKHADDKHDAFWLAEMLHSSGRLHLPEGGTANSGSFGKAKSSGCFEILHAHQPPEYNHP